ncbi:M56 family metallopeptidase [Candidatus Avoscillospira sp. LCP25S3_F1]|uniref:M56 family metallopeptidase n=1 Tax=Candidatus Avoscillospira sp. LCP25S3_F1 TaxID=3438825 RepID=UPI003F922D03
MSIFLLLKVILALILAAALAWALYLHDEREEDREIQPKKLRYTPFLPVGLLPTMLGVLVPLLWYQFGLRAMAETILTMGFTILIQLSLYTACLMAFLPLLRRRLRPSVCAILWMLPNYLYLCSNGTFRTGIPRVVLKLPGRWFVRLGIVWLAGFAAVMLWGIGAHLRFRHVVLSQAQPVMEPDILNLLERERDHAGQRKKRYRLVRSPAVQTPMTIGLFSRSTRIVLPDRTYTMEELQLIFRHEMVHIGRRDSEAKFYLLFCTALGWWNPLMWLARRRSADDLELSCDETVLHSMDGDCRRPYAELLLRTAGDQRGFTTCLSASAGALRYRLRQVMNPGKRTSGFVVTTVAFTLLLTTMGNITVGYLPKRCSTLLLDGAATDTITVEEAYTLTDSGMDKIFYRVTDETALWNYLLQHEAYRINQLLYGFELGLQESFIILWYRSGGEQRAVTLYQDYIQSMHWLGP